MRTLIAVFLALGLIGAGAASADPTGHQARRTSGTVHASLIHPGPGGLYYADGDFQDSLLGRGAIIYRVRADMGPQNSVLVKSPSVTLYTRRGSMTGTAQAVQTNQGTGPDAPAVISDGRFRLTRGTGAYRGHRYTGTFSGTLANGVYTFTYRGTYR